MLSTLLTVGLFIFGFFILINGAELLIKGASSLAKKLKLSDLIIGLTVVAFGTSLPELVVNLFATSSGAPDLAIGNIVGSNIANIMLILGVCAIVTPLTLKRVTVWREVLFTFIAGGILLLLVSDNVLATGGFEGLDVIDGAVLIVFFVLFIYYSFGHKTVSDDPDDDDELLPIGRSMIYILLGILGLGFGGHFIVDGATQFASSIGISESIIGLTIVAIGTSAPEMVASIAAVRRRKIDIAVGNVLGSNLFNTFWVLGLSAAINPVPFSEESYLDVFISVAAAGALFGFMFLGTKHTLHRRSGIVFVCGYTAYIGFLVARELMF